MNIKMIRSDEIYKKIMIASAEKKDDIYRYEMMKPFEFKWSCYNVPLKSKQKNVVNKKRISVSKEIHTVYYQQKERETYLDKLSDRYNLSFEECDGKGIQVEYLLSCSVESLENVVIKQEMLAGLKSAIGKLSDQERLLIYELFLKGKSERQLSAETGIPQRTINDRKHNILSKLKNIWKSKRNSAQSSRFLEMRGYFLVTSAAKMKLYRNIGERANADFKENR